MVLLNEIPNEIIIEIFEYCKVLPLTLVSNKFNEIISNSPVLMRKMNLIISEKSDSVSIRKSKRKHQAVCFKFNYKISESFVDVLKGFEIKSLEMVRCIVSAEVFLKLLDSLEQLESLSIFTTFIKKNQEDMPQIEAPQLRRLKKLNLRNSDFAFLKFLEGSNLEKLSLLPPTESVPVSTKMFLKTQLNIRTIDFLHVSSVDEELLTILTQDLNRIKRLHLEADRVDMSQVRELNLRNESVEFLNICKNTAEPGDYNLLLSYFKNVKCLEIEMNSQLEPANIVQLQLQWPKLESLFLTYCSGDFFNYIQFNNLKRLVLTDGSQSTNDWQGLARRNPSIEKIVVKDESITNDHFAVICNDFRNLKYLEINYDPQRLTSDVLNFICDPLFPSNIKYLKIVQRVAPGETFLALSEEQKQAVINKFGFRLILN